MLQVPYYTSSPRRKLQAGDETGLAPGCLAAAVAGSLAVAVAMAGCMAVAGSMADSMPGNIGSPGKQHFFPMAAAEYLEQLCQH